MSDKKIHEYRMERHKWPDEIREERRRRRNRIIIPILAVVLFFGGFISGGFLLSSRRSVATGGSTDSSKQEIIKQILENDWYFRGEYGDTIDQDLLDKAINGMVENEWDKHTEYMSVEEASQFSSSLEGSVVGIGVRYYDLGNSTYMITQVIHDSPAEESGMLAGDQIYKVDGVPTSDKTIDEVGNMVKGKEGTNVTITVKRGEEEIDIDLVRRTVSSSATYEIEGDVGVLSISSFGNTTASDAQVILDKFQAQGIDRIVIDLRDNGGGYLKTAQELATMFVPQESTTYREKDADGKEKSFQTANGYSQYEFSNVVVLVNGNSASASEVLTMALKENIDCTVVGVNTYGKGTMQVSYPFSDGSSFKYTVGEWLSPTGQSINKVGIAPDVESTLDDALTTGAVLVGEDVVKPDTVHESMVSVQTYLKFLGYGVERTDAYYAPSTEQYIKEYQTDNGMEANGIVNDDLIRSIVSSVSRTYRGDLKTYDLQMNKAIEVARGE